MPSCLQPLDQFVELADFLVRQRRRRLVHDDDAGIDRQRARDGDQVAVGDAEIAQAHGRIDAGADPVQQVARPAHSSRCQSIRPKRLRGAWPMKDILGDRQFVEQHRFLVNGGDAGMQRGMRRRESGSALPSSAICAFVGLVDAGQDLDQVDLPAPFSPTSAVTSPG